MASSLVMRQFFDGLQQRRVAAEAIFDLADHRFAGDSDPFEGIVRRCLDAFETTARRQIATRLRDRFAAVCATGSPAGRPLMTTPSLRVVRTSEGRVSKTARPSRSIRECRRAFGLTAAAPAELAPAAVR